MHFAAEEQAVEGDEGTRTVRLMTYAPKVRYGATWIAEVAASRRRRSATGSRRSRDGAVHRLPRRPCEHRVPLRDHRPQHLGAPEAILELDFKRQGARASSTSTHRPAADQEAPADHPPHPNLAAWLAEWKRLRRAIGGRAAPARPLVWKGEPWAASSGDAARQRQVDDGRGRMAGRKNRLR
jgi:hypothetical protein